MIAIRWFARFFGGWRLRSPEKTAKHVFGGSPGSPSAGMVGEIPSDDPFFSQEQIRTLRTRFENREVRDLSHPSPVAIQAWIKIGDPKNGWLIHKKWPKSINMCVFVASEFWPVPSLTAKSIFCCWIIVQPQSSPISGWFNAFTTALSGLLHCIWRCCQILSHTTQNSHLFLSWSFCLVQQGQHLDTCCSEIRWSEMQMTTGSDQPFRAPSTKKLN